VSTESDPIVCRTTPWYHKRRIAMLLLIFGFSAYFFYDWKIGYPRKREISETYVRLKDEGREAEYAKLAAENDWPRNPEPKTADEWDHAITEQLVCGILAAAGGAVMLFFYLRTVRGSLSADAVSFSTPDGRRVPFASAFRIDRRKWDHKGLAYVFYRDDKGREKRAVIDDLIFGGADQVLKRLEDNFRGEIIDLEKKAEAPPAAEDGTEDAAEADAGTPAKDREAAAAPAATQESP
jgi:hypothetical protein